MTKHTPQYDASKYATYRPTYPAALYERIFSLVMQFDRAWDCACGNGQATRVIADHFKQVVGTDISTTQIAAALQEPNIEYLVSPADETPCEDQSIDLVTVAQAMHWFANEDFFNEVKRVLKPSGVLAAWCYDLPKVNAAVDKVVLHLAYTLLDAYWASGREYIQAKYKDIPFPFVEQYSADLFCEKTMCFDDLIGLFESWSPCLKYWQDHDADVLDLVRADLASAWGDPTATYQVKFPIYLITGSP